MKNISLLKVYLCVVMAAFLAGMLASGVRAETGTLTDQLGDLVFTRTAPKMVDVGQNFWVVVQVENTGSQMVEFSFVERLGNAEFDQSQALAINVFDPGYGMPPPAADQQGFNLWVYKWSIKLEPGQKTSLAYWLVVPSPGSYVISPARIELGDQKDQLSSWTIEVRCAVDGTCQNAAGENFLTCPDDCASGAADSFCDGELDGIVDPDCEAGADPDGSAALTQPAPLPTTGNPIIPKGLTDLCPFGGAALLLPLVGLSFRHFRRL
jgi:hypothetical protein